MIKPCKSDDLYVNGPLSIVAKDGFGSATTVWKYAAIARPS